MMNEKLHELGNALQEVSHFIYLAKETETTLDKVEKAHWKCCGLFKEIVALYNEKNAKESAFNSDK